MGAAARVSAPLGVRARTLERNPRTTPRASAASAPPVTPPTPEASTAFGAFEFASANRVVFGRGVAYPRAVQEVKEEVYIYRYIQALGAAPKP